MREILALHPSCIRGRKPLAAFRTFHPFKIHPLDQIRRDRYSALRAHLVPAMPALLPDRVFVIGALQTPREL
jgi:hypothetical protein